LILEIAKEKMPSKSSVEQSHNPQPVEVRLKQVEARLNTILKISQTLGTTRDPDELLSLIMTKITGLMEAERSTLFLVNKEENVIWSKILQGEDLIQIRLPIGTGLAGWVAETGEKVNLYNAYEDPRFHPEIDQETGFTTTSVLVMPLHNQRGHIIGVVQVLNKQGGAAPFTEEDEWLLEAISAQAAIFLENAQLYHTLWQKNIDLLRTSQQLKQRSNQLDILYAIERQMSRAFNLSDMMTKILLQMLKFQNCEAGSIAIIEEDKYKLFSCTYPDEGKPDVQEGTLKPGKGFIGWSIAKNQAVVSNNPSEDHRYRKEVTEGFGMEIDSVICVPLTSNNQLVGALELFNKKDGRGFHGDDLKILRIIGAQVGQAIEIGQQRERQAKENRLAAIGKLLSGLLHDLKTPMTLISGYAQMMASQQDSEKRSLFGKEIEKQVERLNKMTREVLAFAKGKSTLLIRKVLMNQFSKEIKSDLVQEFKDYPIEFECLFEYQGEAYFDETKIQRLIFNMARNARQAMPKGGSFNIRAWQDGERLHFSFADTGTGIPKELQANIFDSFVTGRPSGSGLGLAIVKKIVREHQGEIEFESTPGEGTTFHVWLPINGPKTSPTGTLEVPAFQH